MCVFQLGRLPGPQGIFFFLVCKALAAGNFIPMVFSKCAATRLLDYFMFYIKGSRYKG